MYLTGRKYLEDLCETLKEDFVPRAPADVDFVRRGQRPLHTMEPGEEPIDASLIPMTMNVTFRPSRRAAAAE